MIPSRKFAAVLLATLAGAAAIAFSGHAQPQAQQSQPQVPMPAQLPSASNLNRNLVFLDPAHGASDPGATLGDHLLEKDVTLAYATSLHTALSAAGFTVIETRTSDPADPLTTDQRAEIANRTHAVACIVLHATTTGSGVHIYTSMLQPASTSEDSDAEAPASFVPQPWETAQAASVSQSLRLASDLGGSLAKSNLPLLVGKAAISPLDNLTCPAVAIEIGPLTADGETTAVTNQSYQQRVVTSLTAGLGAWRSHADPFAAALPESAEAAARAKAIATAEAAGLAAARAHAGTQSQKGSQ